MKRTCIFILLIFVSHCASKKVSKTIEEQNPSEVFYTDIIKQWTKIYADRRKDVGEALKSKKGVKKYQERLHQKYSEIVDYDYEPAPLNAQFIERLDFDNYNIDKIVFESLENHHVAANLYQPKGQGPFPTVLFLSGHEIVGKTGGTYQMLAQLFASNGFVVLTLDPTSQGERIQLVDEDGKTLTRGATTEHTLLNAGSMLVGTSLPVHQLRDNVAALDFLESLPSVDSDRMGVVGNSGGGNQLAYLWGFDHRLKVAAPCSFFTKRERYVKSGGPQDGCQQILGEEWLEISDFFIMQAPKPVIVLAGEKDFVDFEGTLEAIKELKSAYDKLGYPDRVKLFTQPDGHGIGKEKREATLKWFAKWLKTDSLLTMIDAQALNNEDLLATKTGNVITSYNDEMTIMDINMAKYGRYNHQRNEFKKMSRRDQQKIIKELLFLDKYLPNPNRTKNIEARTSSKGSAKILILLEEENNAFTFDTSQYEMIFRPEISGLGKFKDQSDQNNKKYWNTEYRVATIGFHLNRPIVGQRVSDLTAYIQNIGNKFPESLLEIKASGKYIPVAIYSSFLEDRIHNVQITEYPRSYLSFVKNPMQKEMYSSIVPGALKYFDLPDIVDLLGHRVFLK